MDHTTISERIRKMIAPVEARPCPGCGDVVDVAFVLGRLVFACDGCADKERKKIPLDTHMRS